jgi:hypothetical protein
MADEATKRQRGSFEGMKELRENQKNEILNNIPILEPYQNNHSEIIPAAQQALLAPSIAITPERELCEGEHCFQPEEKNVFSPPTPTPAPTISPQPTSFRTDPTTCESDGQGNYGIIDSSSFRIVNYRYQVETTQELNAMLLNFEVLQDVENAISDVLVKRFFLESCTPPVINVIPMPSIQPPEAPPMVLTKAVKQQDGDNSHKFLLRRLKSEYHENLVGLSAKPEDLVLQGLEGGKLSIFAVVLDDVGFYFRVPSSHIEFGRGMSISYHKRTLFCRWGWRYNVWGRRRRNRPRVNVG